jgi:hypothetical protein
MDINSSQSTDWHDLYTGERRRTHLLGAATVAASLLAVAAGAWGLSNADAAASGSAMRGGPGMSQVGPGQAGPPTTPGQSQGPLGQDLATMLFTSDGEVNEELLEEFLSRLPGGLDQFLQIAVQNGELTDQQADALRAAAPEGS